MLDVLGALSLVSPYGLCGRKATLNLNSSELRSCVKVEVAVLGSPSLIVRTVSVLKLEPLLLQSSGAA